MRYSIFFYANIILNADADGGKVDQGGERRTRENEGVPLFCLPHYIFACFAYSLKTCHALVFCRKARGMTGRTTTLLDQATPAQI
jgi:hypothetical protein